MANLILATPIISDLGTMELVGSEAASMEAINLYKTQPTDVWRATDLANIWFETDLGSAKAIKLIALLFTNATSSATIRVRAATTQANLTASPGYDSGVVSHWPTTGLDNWSRTHAIIWNSTAETFRWWRIDITDASNPSGYYQAGRLYLSNPYQPVSNIDYGWGNRWEDNSSKQTSIANQTYSDVRTPRRILNFNISFESEDDMYGQDSPFEIDMLRGTSKDMLVIVDPTKNSRLQAWSVYGLFNQLDPIVNPAFQLFQKRYQVVEML